MRTWATLLVGFWPCVAPAQSVRGIYIPTSGSRPFTGQDTIVWTHLIDGRVVTMQLVETVARDGQGRVHREGHQFSPVAAEPNKTLTSLQIYDPVAGTNTMCNVASHSCRLAAFPLPVVSKPAKVDAEPSGLDSQSAAVPAITPPVSRKRVVNVENLGVQTIDGFKVEGTRRTTSLASTAGGEALVVSSIESWFSGDLMLGVSETRKFLNGDVEVVRFKLLSQEEPDANLFKVPPGFTTEDDRTLQRVGGGVSAPVVLSSAPPEFSEEARRRKVAGNVLVSLVVDEHGLPTRVRVVRGIGLGLDEKAIQAVKKYKFKPAMKDGKPIAVELMIDVNFQIF